MSRLKKQRKSHESFSIITKQVKENMKFTLQVIVILIQLGFGHMKKHDERLEGLGALNLSS